MNIYFGACVPNAARKCNTCIYSCIGVYVLIMKKCTHVCGGVCARHGEYMCHMYINV